MNATVTAVAYALPEGVLDNDQVVAALGRGKAEDLYKKTGIRERRVAPDGMCGSDLACAAAKRLFESGAASPDEIDFVLYITQTPDHFSPATSCLLHNRLGLPRNAVAFDLSQGCTGYIQLLATGYSWIAAGLGRCGLLLTGDTMTRLVAPGDPATLPIFGDAGTATIIRATDGNEGLGSFVFGTDGAGACHLVVEHGAFRSPLPAGSAGPSMVMNGLQIFDFTLTVVPEIVDRCLQAAECDREGVDYFLLHQANGLILKHLCTKLGVPVEKVPVRMERCGNTAASSIPIVLADLAAEGVLQSGMRLMLVGFGVGLSWGACVLQLGAEPPKGLPEPA